MKLSERDKKIIWHPFTQQKTAKLPIAIKKAKGSYLYDENNKAYLDLISSWWVNMHGHTHPKIAEAIYQQSLCLEHVIFAGFTHEPAIKLCEDLQKLLPNKLSKFFFSDNGSTSVEVAIKMAYQYWWNQGYTEKTIFLSFEGGYHGDTFGAMSVGATSAFHAPFTKLFFSILTIPFADTWHQDYLVQEKEALALNILKNHLINNAAKIAALILEPLVQGASGMRMCRPKFINDVVDLVRSYGVLIIFDEIMTGFYRTGSCFAFEQTTIIPDFLCISKGLTGGFLPLALTITSEQIYEMFLSDSFSHSFAHGHSYTANPLSCSAAIASLQLFNNTNTLNAINNIIIAQQRAILNLLFLQENINKIQKIRTCGTILAFDININNYENNIMEILKYKFIEQGLLIRPLGNTIYVLPPYCIQIRELEESYKTIISIICN